jgi:hypothetical protein
MSTALHSWVKRYYYHHHSCQKRNTGIMSTANGDKKNKNNHREAAPLLPSMIVFDLDDCLWTPEMHELPDMPEIPIHGDLGNGQKGVIGLKVARYADSTVTLYDGARKVLHELATNPLYRGVVLATASSSLEPSYSYACLDGIEISPGSTIADMMRYVRIFGLIIGS